MAALKRFIYYLGLSAEEYPEDEQQPPQPEQTPPANPLIYGNGDESHGLAAEPDNMDYPMEPMVTHDPLEPIHTSSTVTVMPIAKPKVQVLNPRSFQDVKEIGDNLKDEKPIIVNLQETPQDISRRIVDFASGVCFALGGQMERVADLVYLLVPPDMEINPEDRVGF